MEYSVSLKFRMQSSNCNAIAKITPLGDNKTWTLQNRHMKTLQVMEIPGETPRGDNMDEHS